MVDALAAQPPSWHSAIPSLAGRQKRLTITKSADCSNGIHRSIALPPSIPHPRLPKPPPLADQTEFTVNCVENECNRPPTRSDLADAFSEDEATHREFLLSGLEIFDTGRLKVIRVLVVDFGDRRQSIPHARVRVDCFEVEWEMSIALIISNERRISRWIAQYARPQHSRIASAQKIDFAMLARVELVRVGKATP
jgi:hypothetical protein